MHARIMWMPRYSVCLSECGMIAFVCDYMSVLCVCVDSSICPLFPSRSLSRCHHLTPDPYYPPVQLHVSRLPICPWDKAEVSLFLCLCSIQWRIILTQQHLHCFVLFISLQKSARKWNSKAKCCAWKGFPNFPFFQSHFSWRNISWFQLYTCVVLLTSLIFNNFDVWTVGWINCCDYISC